jgi:hypothetical protein
MRKRWVIGKLRWGLGKQAEQWNAARRGLLESVFPISARRWMKSAKEALIKSPF